MGWLNVVLLLYGLLDIVMGILGYINKNSLPSLIAGCTCGVIVLVTIVVHKFQPRAARITALVVAALMMGNFAKGTFVDNHLYPAGIMFVASLGVAICLFTGHMAGMKARKAEARETAKH